MAWNICDFLRTFLVVLSILILFGKVTADVVQCGSLEIEQPTILGRNVTFTFTPESTSKADVKWQRTIGSSSWSTLPNDHKFTQYHRDGTYYLILTNTVKDNDEVIYRVEYNVNSVSCLMTTPRLELQVAPSAPVFEGFKDIEGCKGCIIGEDGYQFSVLCKTTGDTQPVQVTMPMGNESLSSGRYNGTANKHHMAIMKCTVINDAFTTPLIITAQVYVINPSIIEFNISGSDLTHVKCSAKSIPTSNISWAEQSDAGNMPIKQCGLQTDCSIAIEANLTKQRIFICQADYLQTSDQKNLTVNILEKDEQQHKDMDNSASGKKLLIWIILGSSLAVVFLVVIVAACIIARKRKRKNKAKLETNQVIFSAMPDGVSNNKEDKLEGDPRGNLNDGAHAFDDTEVTYSQPVKNKPASNADATYSTVNKTRKSNAETSCSKTNEEGQMLYADLDFDSNGASLKGATAKRRDSPTDYVTIDFVQTATGMADENKPPEVDNIYANQ